jgi:hypothetical protein
MGVKGRSYAKNWLDREQILARWEDLLDNLINRR